MQITQIDLVSYRNYQKQRVAFGPSLNLLTGNNAQGKTNLIEALYYFSIGKAYRSSREEQLVPWGESQFQIKADFCGRQGKSTIEIKYALVPKKCKEIFLGGLPLQKKSQLSGLITSVLFAPENLTIVKGSPQERRRFLDYDLTQMSQLYASGLSKYHRLLNQRNALLKKIRIDGLTTRQYKTQMELWNQQLIETGSQLIEKRLDTLDKLNPLTRLMQRKISKGEENIELKYLLCQNKPVHSAQDVKEILSQMAEENWKEDLRLGTTQWGPHRDDFLLSYNGKDLKSYGSQGQQRSTVLALKLAELELFRGETGEYPLLLLDDVLSELDASRQKQLVEIIQDKAIQCFITSTEASLFEGNMKRAMVHYKIDKGQIQPL